MQLSGLRAELRLDQVKEFILLSEGDHMPAFDACELKLDMTRAHHGLRRQPRSRQAHLLRGLLRSVRLCLARMRMRSWVGGSSRLGWWVMTTSLSRLDRSAPTAN